VEDGLPGSSHEVVSKIDRRKQIAEGSGAAKPTVMILAAEVMRLGERVGGALRDGSDGQGFSRSAVAHAPHNTLLPRRGLRPLANAGEGVGLS
jgi:hypothetical protein